MVSPSNSAVLLFSYVSCNSPLESLSIYLKIISVSCNRSVVCINTGFLPEHVLVCALNLVLSGVPVKLVSFSVLFILFKFKAIFVNPCSNISIVSEFV